MKVLVRGDIKLPLGPIISTHSNIVEEYIPLKFSSSILNLTIAIKDTLLSLLRQTHSEGMQKSKKEQYFNRMHFQGKQGYFGTYTQKSGLLNPTICQFSWIKKVLNLATI